MANNKDKVTKFKDQDYEIVKSTLEKAIAKMDDARNSSELPDVVEPYGKTTLVTKYHSDYFKKIVDNYNKLYNKLIGSTKVTGSEIKDILTELENEYKRVKQMDKQDQKKTRRKRLKDKLSAAITAGNTELSNKYIKKLTKNKALTEKYKNYLKTLAKDAGFNLKWTQSGNIKSLSKIVQQQKPSDDPYKETGATVVSATGIGAKGKNVVITASIKKEIRKIIKEQRKLRDEEIDMIKAAGEKEKEQINTSATINKGNLEIEKNKLKADINEEAIKEINAIANDDPEAEAKIAAIIEKRDKALALVDSNYETEVAKIEAQKDDQLKALDASVENKIKEVKHFYNKRIKSMKGALDDKEIGKGSLQQYRGYDDSVRSESTTPTSDATTPTTEDTLKTLAQDITTSQETYTTSENNFSKAVVDKRNAISEPAVGTPVEDTPVTPTPQPEPQPAPQPQPEQTIPNVTPQSTPTSSSNSGNSSSYSNNSNSSSTATSSSSTSNSTSSTTNEHPSVPRSVESETTKTDTVTTKIIDDKTNEVITPSKSKTSSEKSSGGAGVIPAVLGVGAAGAAAVAGVRYFKNKKDNSYEDEEYDDENNAALYAEETDNTTDDYLGPAGSEYTDTSSYEAEPTNIVPDENSYVDPSALSDEEEIENFEDDEVMKGLK